MALGSGHSLVFKVAVFAYDPFACSGIAVRFIISATSSELIDFLLLVERPPQKGSRGTAQSRNSVGQKMKKKKGESLKGVGGDENVSNQGAQQSDRTEEVALNDGESVADNVDQPPKEEGRMRRGFRRILTSVSGLCKRVSTLILKVVKTIFPWNRRARRRLANAGNGVEDEEEL